MKVQEQFKAIKAKSNPLKKSFGSKQKNMLALQAQNEKMIEEYDVLQAEHKEDESFILKLKEYLINREYTQLHTELVQVEVQIKETNEKSVRVQESNLLAVKRLKEDLQVLSQQKEMTSQRTSEIEEELEKVQRISQRIKKDFENLKNFILNKLEVEGKLLESVRVHEKNENELICSVQEAKNDLFNSRSFYQEFQIRVISLMMPCNGKLVFRKTSENEHVVEILYKGKVDSILFRQIEDLFEHPSKENRLVIKYKSKTRDVITEEKQRILQRMREILAKCGKNLS